MRGPTRPDPTPTQPDPTHHAFEKLISLERVDRFTSGLEYELMMIHHLEHHHHLEYDHHIQSVLIEITFFYLPGI